MASGSRVLCEAQFIKRGKVTKRICFMEDNKGWSVHEQELKPQVIDKTQFFWDCVFFMPFPQRNIARSAYIGRIAIASYEEGNVDAP